MDASIEKWFIMRTTRMASASCSLLCLRDHFLERSVQQARGSHIFGQHVYQDAQVLGAFGHDWQGEVSRTPRDDGVYESLRE